MQKTQPSDQTPLKAQTYLVSKHIPQTITYLVSQLLYARPIHPQEFLVRKINELKTFRMRGQSAPSFSRDDLGAYFRTLDVVGKGSISLAQYKEGLRRGSNMIAMIVLGVKPSASVPDIVNKTLFIEDAIQGMMAVN